MEPTRFPRPPALTRDEPLVWSPGRGTDVWEMFRAAAGNDVDTLRRLLAADPSLGRCHYEYRSPLSFAIRADAAEAAVLLLQHGGGTFGSPLEMARERGLERMESTIRATLASLTGFREAGEEIAAAIRERDVERVERMLAAEPDRVHAADERGNRPIHWAVMTRNPRMIDTLLARGADIDARRPDGARPVQLTNGDYDHRGWRDVPTEGVPGPRDILEHLREHGATVDLCTAAYIGDVARVRELLAQDPGLAGRCCDYITYYACSGAPLRNAAAAGHREIVELLLEHGADPNLPEEHIAPRGHALHAAVCNGHHEIVELLLEHGAYPNVEIESSADTLSAAIRSGNRRMIDLLCSWGAARSLHLLAYYDDVCTAAAVLDADPSRADDPEALAYASSEAFLRLLLHHAPGLPQRTTVVLSAPLSRELLERGMDPSRPDWLGITPLHRLAQRADIEAAAVFLEHGADLEARDEEYRSTPLGWAARAGAAPMAAFLLERGADPAPAGSPDWAQPLAWARRRGHAEIAAMLDRSDAPT